LSSLPIPNPSSAAPPAPAALQLHPEDLLWSGLAFPVLSEEELARQRAALGDRVHFHQGVWWEQARPFFCMPCAPLARLDQSLARPALRHSLLGFTHLALPGTPANGRRQMIAAENVSRYSIATLSRKRRSLVRKALSYLQIRPIERLDDLLTDGYAVYVSWHQRNGWGCNRSDRAAYSAWITRAFSQPRRLSIGVYRGDRLVAFSLTLAVGNVAEPSFLASHTDALDFLPNDALFHAILCISRQTPGIDSVDFGPVAAKPTLNEFKLHYATLKSIPSYTWVNPLLRPLFARWTRHRYPWLHLPGATESPKALATESLDPVS